MFLFVPSIVVSMKNEEAWQRLGQYVVRDRVRAGYKTTKALAARMGLTPRLVGDIERGRRSSYSPSTYAALEEALNWAPGSVDDVLIGRDPTYRGPAPDSVKPLPPWSEDEARQRLEPEWNPQTAAEAQAMLRAVTRALGDAVEAYTYAQERAATLARDLKRARAVVDSARSSVQDLQDREALLARRVSELTRSPAEEDRIREAPDLPTPDALGRTVDPGVRFPGRPERRASPGPRDAAEEEARP